MYLYLVRHAIAEEREDFAKKNIGDDSLRPLTEKGRKRMEKVMEILEKEFDDIDLIVTSPYVRARQTAEIISKYCPKVRVAESAELVPHALPSAFLKWLKSQGKNINKVIAIGHNPHISSFASYLLSGNQFANFMAFKKSSVAMIETGSFEDVAAGHAQLLWFHSPKK